MSGFQLKRKKLVSQPSLIDVEFQSHTFETTKWINLYVELGESKSTISYVVKMLLSMNVMSTSNFEFE